MYRHANIYIGWYDNITDVSYRRNSTDIHRRYLLIKVLCCCSAWSVQKPKLLLRLWPCLINANALSCSQCTEPSWIIIRPVYNSPDKTLYDVIIARRFWCGKQMIVCKQTRLHAFVFVGLSRLDRLAFSIHQKRAYVTGSRNQVYTELDVVWFFITVKWWF